MHTVHAPADQAKWSSQQPPKWICVQCSSPDFSLGTVQPDAESHRPNQSQRILVKGQLLASWCEQNQQQQHLTTKTILGCCISSATLSTSRAFPACSTSKETCNTFHVVPAGSSGSISIQPSAVSANAASSSSSQQPTVCSTPGGPWRPS